MEAEQGIHKNGIEVGGNTCLVADKPATQKLGSQPSYLSFSRLVKSSPSFLISFRGIGEVTPEYN
jgi:hypothetical protein